MNLDCRVIILLSLSVLLVVAGAYAADWKSIDIGSAAEYDNPGSTEYDEVSGNWIIKGDGRDIWGTGDGCRFVYQEVSGDFEISCQVLSVENTHASARGGVMARTTTEKDSAYALAVARPKDGNGGVFQWRREKGGGSEPDGWGLKGPEYDPPYYVKLVREGNTFFGFKSKDGNKWEELHTVNQPSQVEIEMGDPVLVGLVVNSHAGGILCTAEFDSLEASFLEPITNVEPCRKLPITWAEVKD